MVRRPEPETIDAAAPRPPIRPDQGYRVGARITAGDNRSPRLAMAIAAGIVLVGITFNAMAPLLPDAPALPIAPPSPRRVLATPLPDVAVLRPPGPTRPVPVVAGGIRWLDPADGSMSGDAYTAPRGSVFVDAEGRALCVCLEIPWSPDARVTQVTLRRFAAGGDEIARAPLYELHASKQRVYGDQIQVDAAIAPDGTTLWIVHAVRGQSAWEIGIDRVDLASLAVEASRIVERIPVPASEADGALGAGPDAWVTHARSGVRATLRISPDGETLAIVASALGNPDHDPRLPAYQERRLFVSADLDPSVAPVVVAPVHDATLDSCDSEWSAWATDRHFVTVCRRPAGDAVEPYVRIESPTERAREVTVGLAVGAEDSAWLLDARAGALYRWSPFGHVFVRLDVASGSSTTTTIDRAGDGPGQPGRWPAAVGGAVPWVPLTGPDPFVPSPKIVGSADGSLVYALGYRSAADALRDDRIASTGIWVIDAASGELVANWAPGALYDELAMAPGWDRLVAIGMPGVDAQGAPADWATSMWFHDVRTGDVIEMIGDVEELSGFRPALLAPNAPRGIAGF